MILYHGSSLEIVKPDLMHSRLNVDFGRGFYTTPIYEQAVRWCGKFKRHGKSGIVSYYEFDEKAYDVWPTIKCLILLSFILIILLTNQRLLSVCVLRVPICRYVFVKRW